MDRRKFLKAVAVVSLVPMGFPRRRGNTTIEIVSGPPLVGDCAIFRDEDGQHTCTVRAQRWMLDHPNCFDRRWA